MKPIPGAKMVKRRPDSLQHENQIPAHQRQVSTDPHAHKGHYSQRAEEIPLVLIDVPLQSAQGGHSHNGEASRQLAGGKNE
jgi:hypothetical protein